MDAPVFIVRGQRVGPNGEPVKEAEKPEAKKPVSPFADFSPAVQKALSEAGITTVEGLKGKTLEELKAIKGVGETTAEKLLELK